MSAQTILQTVSGIKVLKESKTTTTATLDVAAAMEGRPVKATVQLVLEKDGWKVASGPERWVDGDPMKSVVRRVPLQ